MSEPRHGLSCLVPPGDFSVARGRQWAGCAVIWSLLSRPKTIMVFVHFLTFWQNMSYLSARETIWLKVQEPRCPKSQCQGLTVIIRWSGGGQGDMSRTGTPRKDTWAILMTWKLSLRSHLLKVSLECEVGDKSLTTGTWQGALRI